MNIFVHWTNENGGVSLMMSYTTSRDIICDSITFSLVLYRPRDSHASFEWYHPSGGHKEVLTRAGSNMGRLTYIHVHVAMPFFNLYCCCYSGFEACI